MTDRLEYNGFIISALRYQLAHGRDRVLRIQIELHTGDRVTIRSFRKFDTLKTRKEAVSHCFQFGKRIVDGDEPGLTIIDMY